MQLFRVQASTPKEAIQVSLQEEYSHRQARTPASAWPGGSTPSANHTTPSGPVPMELGLAEQQDIRCYGCGRLGRMKRACPAAGQRKLFPPGPLGLKGRWQKPRPEARGTEATSRSGAPYWYCSHACLQRTLKTAVPSERDSHCKKQDDKPNLVILKIRSKRENSLRALVDSGASNNFVRQQSLPKLNFEDVDTPRSVLEVRLATGATVRTEKRVVRVRFSYKHRVFVEDLIVLDLDDKFDLVLGMPWFARHDPVVN
ncbi:hypothetical protein PI126_g14450 [Phytophthora idaei]|nr:hypothetical protein PI126_g14450 [Phytophthora idaei]